jgi:predicted AAA+ superfamily ATPase
MKRVITQVLLRRFRERRRYIQAFIGPRQVGKSTVARDVIKELDIPVHSTTADIAVIKDGDWVVQQWEIARVMARESPKGALLVLDEIQKITGWSERIKWLWDEDSAEGVELRVLLLGSSPLLIQSGLSESLAGRFEVVHATHWSYQEMKELAGWSVEEYIYYGGYPGAASLVADDPERWRQYVRDSLIETTISRDVLLMNRVDKPALLRRLFELACLYSGQILSYQKMIGQLQDAGSTVTIAHYLDLLGGVGMVSGLQKYAGEFVRRRASIPKLQVWNTALMSALGEHTLEEAIRDREYWGRLAESAVGAYLLNAVRGTTIEVFYWNNGIKEVDYVLKRGREAIGIEVKTSRRRANLSGLKSLNDSFGLKKQIVVGTGGIPIEDFLGFDPATLFV